MKTNKLILKLFCLVATFYLGLPSAFAQPTTNQQLAAYYFQQEDFEKAKLYYEKLYNQTTNDFYYQYLLQCLYKLGDFKEAKKLVKNQMALNPSIIKYKVDYGQAFKKEGDTKKAFKEFNQIIDDLPPVSTQIIELANAFQEIGEFNLALNTFEKGDKLLNGTYPFNFEKARIYGRLSKYDLMIAEYLNLLLLSNNYLQTVQNELARNFAFDQGSTQNSILKQELIKLIQKNPNRQVFSELLIWVYIQENNYSAALIQTKALDKRLNEYGERLMDLASVAASNNQTDVAIDAYEYVIEKGKKAPFYSDARISLMEVLKFKLYNAPTYTQQDVNKLKAAYQSTINELFLTPKTVTIYRDFAHLQAFYLNQPDTAILILKEIMQNQTISPEERGKTKLVLADIYILKDFVWDASLLYSQVDKSFKYDQLGEQAKFKNALISYYVGDFNWAKAQLNVLKGSTSKLIANDAMDISLLITDNTGLDSNEIALSMFARADLKIYQNNTKQANLIFDSILTIYPNHSLTDEIYLKRYEIAMKKQEFKQAETHLQQIIKNHTYDITADNAYFYLGNLYNEVFNDKENAMKMYQELITNYSNSLFVVEARKKFRALRGDNIEQ